MTMVQDSDNPVSNTLLIKHNLHARTTHDLLENGEKTENMNWKMHQKIGNPTYRRLLTEEHLPILKLCVIS